ncbi:hypothetical protein [Leifsonia sp. Leaf264]|uniref:hypothetical protein n=1 Tax=Leifsonia sp. Leaf264 TaxID=1736314 RepID=UPI0012F84F0F|nr:hypothetical protein [Leifsonia sp. Leaf264]
MKVVAGPFPATDGYSISAGAMALVVKTWALDSSTVERVQFVDSGKSYNYAKGGAGVFVGAAVAGPAGALVGGLLPKAFKDSTVRFVIEFKDGRQAHCVGSPREYERALKYSLRPPHDGSPEKFVPSVADRDRLRAELDADEAAKRTEKRTERDRLRAEAAAGKASKKIDKAQLRADSAAQKLTPEQKAERKARMKAVIDQNLPFKEAMRRSAEIDAEYR